MGHAYTYNGLGVSLNDYISEDIINGISLDGKIDNYYADFVGNYVGIHPGIKTEIFIENESALENHSIDKLVQSLSVYRVFGLLDPSLDSEAGLLKIYNILDAASHEADQSLELTISKLGDLLGGNLADQASKQDIELFFLEAEAFINHTGSTFSIKIPAIYQLPPTQTTPMAMPIVMPCLILIHLL